MTPYVALQSLTNSVSCPEYVFLIPRVEITETAQSTFFFVQTTHGIMLCFDVRFDILVYPSKPFG